MSLSTRIKPSYRGGYARRASESTAAPLWDGLVGAWTPELGRTGVTLYDASGQGNHGTLTNMDSATDWTVGKDGYKLDMVAASFQEVLCAGAQDLFQGAGQATISCWASRTATNRMATAGLTISGNNGLGFLWFTDGNLFFSYTNGVTGSFPFVALAGTGLHHIALVFDGNLTGFNRISGYVDGDRQTLTDGGDSPDATLSTSLLTFSIGQGDPGLARFTDGFHGETLLHNRALDDNDIAELFRIGPAGIFQIRQKTVGVRPAVDESSSSSSSSTPTSTSSLSSSSSTPTSTSSLSSSSSSSSTPTSTSSLSSSSSSSSTPTSTSSLSSSSSSSSTPTSTSSLSSSSSSSSTPTSTSSLSSSSSSSSTPTSTSSLSSSSSSSSTPTSTSSQSVDESSSSSSSTPTSTSSLSSSSSSTPTSTSSLSSSSSSSSTPTSTSSLSSSSSSSSTPTSTSSLSSSSSSTPTSTSSPSSQSAESSSSTSSGLVPINPRSGVITDLTFNACITKVGPQSGRISLT